MAMTREKWRLLWLDSINELTSFDLQVQSWLSNQTSNPHWSYVEFRCCYFDDVFPEYEDLIKKGWVTQEEYDIIKDWHERLDKYETPNGNNHDREAILNDSDWIDIVSEGEKAKIELSRILEGKEKAALMEPVDFIGIG